MDRLQAMRVFVRVAELGGFADAARQLGLSPPAATRAVSALEAAIGTRLLARTTRSVKLTEAGARYLEDCRRILMEIGEAEAAAAGSYATPAGTLAVTASLLFGQMYVLPILLDFLALHPAVRARTLFVDRIVNLVEEGIDVAVRIGRLPDSGLSAVRVGSVRRVACAAPTYLAARGTPQVPADLADHDVVATTHAWAATDWHFGDGRSATVTVRPRLVCNTNEAAITAAEAGWGVVRALSYQAAPALAAGRLQAILTDHEEAPLPIHLVHAEGRHPAAKVRAFVDFAAERLRGNRLIER